MRSIELWIYFEGKPNKICPKDQMRCEKGEKAVQKTSPEFWLKQLRGWDLLEIRQGRLSE